MVNNLVFLKETWIWPLLVGAMVLLIAFLWKEWAQAGKHRFLLKGVLIFVAITSLVLLALRPAISSSRDGSNYALLTTGFETQHLDSLKSAEGKIKTLKYEAGVSLPANLRSSEKVYVLGQGVKEFDLWQLDATHVTYLKSEFPRGIIKLNYQVESRVGDVLMLKGLYNNPQEGNLLVLEGPGGAGLDSLVLNGESKMQVQLKTPLKAAGNFVYALVEKDAKGRILNNDLLPVKVSKKENLRILIVNSFPTFETRYLKNYLAEAGQEVVIKSRITTGRYKFEYFNTKSIPIGNISGSVLEPFDLLIADASSLRGFSGSEINAIENQVRDNGLGLFIQPDDNFFNSVGKLFPLNFERVPGSEIGDLQWPGIKLNSFPYRIKKNFGVTGIHNAGNTLISAYKVRGEGRIGTVVFLETWQLMLDGKDEVYKELWSHLIEKLSKKEVSVASWNSSRTIAQKGEPYEFEIRTESADPIVKTKSGSHIPLMQDPGMSFLWKGTTWPRETGWNSLELDTISAHDFYVDDKLSWSALTAIQTMLANERYFKPSERTERESGTLEPINPIWFFSFFLLCMGGLWLEPKIQ